MVGIASPPPNWKVKIPSYITVDSVEYPITKISARSFAQLPLLRSVLIPTTVKSIGFNAFYKTNIKQIVIPYSVTHLDESTFNSMSKLETIIFERGINLTYIGAKIFSYCGKLKQVYYCGNNDMTNITTPFKSSSIPKIFTLETYSKSYSFGSYSTIPSYTCFPEIKKCSCNKRRALFSVNYLLMGLITIT